MWAIIAGVILAQGVPSGPGSKGHEWCFERGLGTQLCEATEATCYQCGRSILRLPKARADVWSRWKTGTMAVHGTAVALEALGKHEALPTRNHMLTTHLRGDGRAGTDREGAGRSNSLHALSGKMPSRYRVSGTVYIPR